MFNPIGDNVVIKQIERTDQTAGGVIIPDTTHEGSRKGEIFAVGPGRVLENGQRGPMQTKVGDIIIYPKLGQIFELEGEEYFIVREHDLLTILEK
jgi:chaperonin GroES